MGEEEKKETKAGEKFVLKTTIQTQVLFETEPKDEEDKALRQKFSSDIQEIANLINKDLAIIILNSMQEYKEQMSKKESIIKTNVH